MARERRTLRWRLAEEEPPYPMLRELKAAGATDYLIVPVHAHHALTQPWASFATSVRTGFTPAEIERMQALCVPMGWKTRVSVAEQSTRSLLRVYLGKNAAERVIGAAVNEASRVESLCKEFGVRLLVTGSFADVLGREGLHRVGSRSLRDVRREQELFTLPELAPASA